MEGTPTLWKFALTARNEEVQLDAMKLLIELQMSLAQHIDRHQIWTDFITQIFEQL